MQWLNRRQSQNIEDQRGRSSGGLVAGGGVGTLLVALVVYFLGGDPRVVLDQSPSGRSGSVPGTELRRQADPEQEKLKQFVSVVLADTEDVWHELLRQQGRRYHEPKLVLFSQQVRSACGLAGAATGPFYCPEDEKLYIDLSFYRQLKSRLGAPGDFAQAYVIAHEVGHHLQNLLGTMDKVQAAQSRLRGAEANQLSVRLELQADYYAGVWAHHAQKRGILETGDVEEAIQAASAVGDDRLQHASRGYVVPDSFTHGSSEQRSRWFQRGLESGDLRQGNTFSAEAL